MAGERYIPGDPWCICDLCGFRYRMSQTLKTWDGLRVCRADWYPKHPQLDVRGVKDVQAVIDGRSEPADVFIGESGWFLAGWFGDTCNVIGNGGWFVSSFTVTPSDL
jgi:hypothetical protein